MKGDSGGTRTESVREGRERTRTQQSGTRKGTRPAATSTSRVEKRRGESTAEGNASGREREWKGTRVEGNASGSRVERGRNATSTSSDQHQQRPAPAAATSTSRVEKRSGEEERREHCGREREWQQSGRERWRRQRLRMACTRNESVPRESHGSPIQYHRELMGQLNQTIYLCSQLWEQPVHLELCIRIHFHSSTARHWRFGQ